MTVSGRFLSVTKGSDRPIVAGGDSQKKRLIAVSEVAAKDEFGSIKNINRLPLKQHYLFGPRFGILGCLFVRPPLRRFAPRFEYSRTAPRRHLYTP